MCSRFAYFFNCVIEEYEGKKYHRLIIEKKNGS